MQGGAVGDGGGDGFVEPPGAPSPWAHNGRSTDGSPVSEDDFEPPPRQLESHSGRVTFDATGEVLFPEPDPPDPQPEIDIASLSVGERLYYVGCGLERNRQMRLRTERQMCILREVSKLCDPQITAKGRQAHSHGDGEPRMKVHERLRLWHERRERLRKRAEAERPEAEGPPPTARFVNKHSEELVGDMHRGPVQEWRAHAAKHYASKNREPPPGRFVPAINPSSVWARRGAGPVEDRLFHDAAEREDKRARLREEAARKANIDPSTDLPLFKPNAARYADPGSRRANSSRQRSQSADPPWRPTRSSPSPSRGKPAWKAWANPPNVPGVRAGWDSPPPVPPHFDDGESPPPASRPGHEATVNSLLSKGQELKEKKKKRRVEHGNGPYPFSPRLNPDSLAAADRLPRRPLHEPVARFAKKGPSRERAPPQSARIISSPDWQDDFIRRNKLLAVKRAESVKRIEKAIVEQDLAGCTFAPKLCRASDAIRAGAAKKRETSRAASPEKAASPERIGATSPDKTAPALQDAPSWASQLQASPVREAHQVSSLPVAARISPPRRHAHMSPPRVESPSGVSATERDVQRVLAEWTRGAKSRSSDP